MGRDQGRPRRRSAAPPARPPGCRRRTDGFLAAVPAALPALTRAEKLTARAAKVGFDWPETAQVVDKIEEELRRGRGGGGGRQTATGSRTRSATSCSRSPTSPAITASTPRRRCGAPTPSSSAASRRSSAGLRAQGRTLDEASLDEMEALWVGAKAAE